MEAQPRSTAVSVRMPAHGVFVFESRHAPGFATPVLRHQFLKVLMVIAGTGQLIHRADRLQFETRDVLHIPPGLPHRLVDHPGDAASLLACCVSVDALRRPLTRRLQLRRIEGADGATSGIEGLMRRMYFEQSAGHDDAPLLLRSLADALLIAVARAADRPSVPSSPAQQRVRSVVNHLERDFVNPLSLGDAAALAGLSRRRFSDLFREATGQTYHERMQSHRVAHAQHLLTTTADSVTTIAFACGFGDLSTFYRAFNRRSGCSPLQWRAAGQFDR